MQIIYGTIICEDSIPGPQYILSGRVGSRGVAYIRMDNHKPVELPINCPVSEIEYTTYLYMHAQASLS